MPREVLQITRIIFCLIVCGLLVGAFPSKIRAQRVVDKTVATVSDNVVGPELITYSDLLWQLALQPDTPINPPNSADLNAALQTLIDQRLFALEAKRLPSVAPSKEEVTAEITRILRKFPVPGEFERRLRLVGFESVDDENFQAIIRQRVAIEKYLDFRFRSFVVVSANDEAQYYRDVFIPDFRRRNPGVLIPSLDEIRARLNEELTERKIAEDMEKFLDDAKRRAQIEILFEV